MSHSVRPRLSFGNDLGEQVIFLVVRHLPSSQTGMTKHFAQERGRSTVEGRDGRCRAPRAPRPLEETCDLSQHPKRIPAGPGQGQRPEPSLRPASYTLLGVGISEMKARSRPEERVSKAFIFPPGAQGLGPADLWVCRRSEV